MLQAMQQQFERMNVVFNDIRDRMDRQDAITASLCEERTQRALNARRQGKHVCVDDSDDYHENEFEDEEDQASLNHEGKFTLRGEMRGRGFSKSSKMARWDRQKPRKHQNEDTIVPREK